MGKKGFTLLELLIVIVIIGVLAAIGIPRYFDAIARARATEARATLTELRKVEQAYFSIMGAYAAITAGGNLDVDLDSDGSSDMSFIQPDSDSFVFSATDVYGEASSTTGGTSYQMDHATGAFTP